MHAGFDLFAKGWNHAPSRLAATLAQGLRSYPGVPVKIRKEMPPTRGASWMREIDGRFACYVVLVRDAFEIKVEQWMGHGILPSHA